MHGQEPKSRGTGTEGANKHAQDNRTGDGKRSGWRIKTIAPMRPKGGRPTDKSNVRKKSPPPGKLVAIRIRNLGSLFQESSYLISSIGRISPNP